MSYTHCKRCGDEITVLTGLKLPYCAHCARLQQQNVPGLSPLQMLKEQIRSLVELSEPCGNGDTIVDAGDLEELYETVQRLVEKEGK